MRAGSHPLHRWTSCTRHSPIQQLVAAHLESHLPDRSVPHRHPGSVPGARSIRQREDRPRRRRRRPPLPFSTICSAVCSLPCRRLAAVGATPDSRTGRRPAASSRDKRATPPNAPPLQSTSDADVTGPLRWPPALQSSLRRHPPPAPKAPAKRPGGSVRFEQVPPSHPEVPVRSRLPGSRSRAGWSTARVAGANHTVSPVHSSRRSIAIQWRGRQRASKSAAVTWSSGG